MCTNSDSAYTLTESIVSSRIARWQPLSVRDETATSCPYLQQEIVEWRVVRIREVRLTCKRREKRVINKLPHIVNKKITSRPCHHQNPG